jgi:hypothetical protein
MIEVLKGMFDRTKALADNPEAKDMLKFIEQVQVDQNLSLHDIVGEATIELSNQKWREVREKIEQSRINNVVHEIKFSSIDTGIDKATLDKMIELVPSIMKRHEHQEPQHAEDHLHTRQPIEVV